ncbi:MAG: bifunctional UDP-N-acetylglucosamine diphosphorylase/glucosamine-1-phosphate N-acetyltransferase GlmU [Coriobacteriaceae bacterium]|nr:bifunctional UDP-N-acetylglucosamine diphosphorylase/glucosamine-1-phosphate N-acetyltransferase GlmU [Coriobacteriaceae bacterium]
MRIAALVLAAGEGTRMRSDLPKVAHAVLGVPMVRLVVDAAREAGCERAVVVTGHRAEVVEGLLDDAEFVRQDRQLGTGHAVMCAAQALADFDGSLLVLSGDTPLVRPETLRVLVEARGSAGAAVSLLTAVMPDPSGYGRIVRDADGAVARIVEQKDASADEAAIREVNTGTYCFDARVLFEHLHRIGNENAQGEYYLTDMVETFVAEGLGAVACVAADAVETLGVNSRVQLAEATRALQSRVNEAHMLAGVTIVAPELAWISPGVRIGRDVVVAPMTFLAGETIIGDRAVLGPNTRITDSRVGADAVIDSSVLVGAEVGPGATVGPVAYLRPGTVLGAGAKAGASVEIKNSRVGAGSKVPHLSYIGDAEIGRDVNVGAGTITCNYDGHQKHSTVIGDGAFIGSDTMLVAPVRIGEGAVTGAGSAIAKDVPPGALGVERSEQRNLEGWAERRRSGREENAKDEK